MEKSALAASIAGLEIPSLSAVAGPVGGESPASPSADTEFSIRRVPGGDPISKPDAANFTEAALERAESLLRELPGADASATEFTRLVSAGPLVGNWTVIWFVPRCSQTWPF